GAGNSAGQAAVFLGRRVSQVSLMIRGDDLAAGMSRYLVDQVEAAPRVEVHTRTEVRALHGDGGLQAVTVEHTRTGEKRTVDARAVFVFIGAAPCADWLSGALAMDDDGFVLTGADLQLAHLDPTGRDRVPTPLLRA